MAEKSNLQNVEALFFDVFGTVVDWKTTITQHLVNSANKALHGPQSGNIPDHVKSRAEVMTLADWEDFAQEWRRRYKAYTRDVASDPSIVVKTIDQHHLDSLQSIVSSKALEGLWTPSEIQALALAWHKLDAWPDSAPGLVALNKQVATCTLSNGNVSLLEDMAKHASLPWQHILSSEMFDTFKPNPAIYKGAAKMLSLQPNQCMMVAAHLNDLEAAHECGFRTAYVERPDEEEWDAVQAEAARSGFVDIWISLRDDGFMELARRLQVKN